MKNDKNDGTTAIDLLDPKYDSIFSGSSNTESQNKPSPGPANQPPANNQPIDLLDPKFDSAFNPPFDSTTRQNPQTKNRGFVSGSLADVGRGVAGFFGEDIPGIIAGADRLFDRYINAEPKDDPDNFDLKETMGKIQAKSREFKDNLIPESERTTWHQGLEGAARSMALKIPAWMAGMAAGAELGATIGTIGGPLGTFIGTVGGGIVGLLTADVFYGLNQYNDAAQKYTKLFQEQGLDPERARNKAEIPALLEAGSETLTEMGSDVIAGSLMAPGLNLVGKKLAEATLREALTSGFIKNAVKRGITTMVSETSSEMTNSIFQGAVEDIYGKDKDLSDVIHDKGFWEKQKENLGVVSVTSAIFSVFAAGGHVYLQNQVKNNLENPVAKKSKREEAADVVAYDMAKVDEDLASVWRSGAQDLIEKNEEISLDTEMKPLRDLVTELKSEEDTPSQMARALVDDEAALDEPLDETAPELLPVGSPDRPDASAIDTSYQDDAPRNEDEIDNFYSGDKLDEIISGADTAVKPEETAVPEGETGKTGTDKDVEKKLIDKGVNVDFIKNKVKELGSVEAVNKHWDDDSAVSQYAKTLAREQFDGEKPAEKITAAEPEKEAGKEGEAGEVATNRFAKGFKGKDSAEALEKAQTWLDENVKDKKAKGHLNNRPVYELEDGTLVSMTTPGADNISIVEVKPEALAYAEKEKQKIPTDKESLTVEKSPVGKEASSDDLFNYPDDHIKAGEHYISGIEAQVYHWLADEKKISDNDSRLSPAVRKAIRTLVNQKNLNMTTDKDGNVFFSSVTEKKPKKETGKKKEYEMTQAEFMARKSETATYTPELHRLTVESALVSGKPVPAEVLADYSERDWTNSNIAALAKKAGAKVDTERTPAGYGSEKLNKMADDLRNEGVEVSYLTGSVSDAGSYSAAKALHSSDSKADQFAREYAKNLFKEDPGATPTDQETKADPEAPTDEKADVVVGEAISVAGNKQNPTKADLVEQKEYLLENIDEAIAEHKKTGNDKSTYTIDVPHDGKFTILGSALEVFKKDVKRKFSTSFLQQKRKTKPKAGKMIKRVTGEGVSYETPYKPGGVSVFPKTKTRETVKTTDGFIGDGRFLVKGLKAPVNRVLEKDSSFFGGDKGSELTATKLVKTAEQESPTVELTDADGGKYTIEAEVFDPIMNKFKGAKVFLSGDPKDKLNTIVFEQNGEAVAYAGAKFTPETYEKWEAKSKADAAAKYGPKTEEQKPAETIDDEISNIDMDELSAMFDEAGSQQEEQKPAEKPAKKPKKKKPVPADLTKPKPKPAKKPSPEPTIDQEQQVKSERTAEDIIKETAKLGVEGVSDAMKGLHELFGGGESTLMSFPAGFNQETYAKAKPHFVSALNNFRAAGKGLIEFVTFIKDQFGAGIKPYLMQFVSDVKEGKLDIAEKDVTLNDKNTNPEKETKDGNSEQAGVHGTDRGDNARNDAQATAEDSQKPHEAVQPEQVQGTEEGGDTGRGDNENGRPGSRRDSRPDGAGLPASRSGIDDDAGAHTTAAGTEALSPANISDRNHSIEDEDNIGKGGEVTKYRDNVAAITLAKQITSENRRATPEEMKILSRYVGWGGLANAFRNSITGKIAKGWESRVEEIEGMLTKSELEVARNSATAAHYTSPTVVKSIWKIINRLGFKGGNVLEPSMGIGNFFGLMPKGLFGKSNVMGVEYDPITATIANLLYPQAKVWQSGFEKVALPSNSFDLVVGNPPFGQQHLSFKYKPDFNKYSIHNQFMLAGIDALKPGGIQVFVVSRYFMDAQNSSVREKIAERANLIGAIRLPDTAFKENARTDVVTDIVIFQKKTADEISYAEAYEAENKVPLPPPKWTETTTIADPAGGERIPVSAYYLHNGNMIVGSLERTGSMRMSGDITVSLDKGANLGKEINARIENLAENILPKNQSAKKSKEQFDAMQENIFLRLDGRQADDVFLSNDGALEQIYEKESPNSPDDYLFASRKLTENSPWHKDLKVDSDGNWYETIDKIGKNGKPVKVVNAEGKRTNRNVKIKRVYKNLSEVPPRKRLGKIGYERLVDLTKLREILKDQLNLEIDNNATEKTIEANRKKLKDAYVAFVAKNGEVNSQEINKLLQMVPDGALVQSLEKKYKKPITKAQAKKLGVKPRDAIVETADILEKRVRVPQRLAEKVDNASDALMLSLAETATVDLDRISELTGKTKDEIIDELHTKPKKALIYNNPETGQWETAGIYLSGKVVKKLEAAKDANLEKNIADLEKVQPELWDAGKVTIAIGNTWIPKKVYNDFARMISGDPNASVEFQKLTNTFVARGNPQGAAAAQWNHPDKDAIKLLEAALRDKKVRITRRTSQGSFLDTAATDSANQKIADIKERFTEWAFEDSARRSELVAHFNKTFNVRTEQEFDGQHLTLPGKVPDHIIKMRRHQLNGIWRGIVDDFVLYDHAVGSGKTYTSIGRAMERKRLGLSNKPLLVVPNHIVDQFTNEAYKLYPGAKILSLGSGELSRPQRRRMFSRIATGDWDMVIMPHSSFEFMSISPETEEMFLQEELRLAIDALAEAQQVQEKKNPNARGKSLSVKAAEALIDKINTRIAKVRQSMRQGDNLLTFEQMGIDDLTVDEAHEYKNLFYNSSLGDVSGMGNRVGSGKAFDLWLKTKVLRNNGGSVAFLTGTPISNSAVEMYSILRYLAPDQLDELGLSHFDAWRSQFATVSTSWEPTESGHGIKSVNRLGRDWTNMRSLMELYRSVADSISNKDVQRMHKEETGEDFPIPRVKGGKDRRAINVPPTEEQLRQIAENVRGFEELPNLDYKQRSAMRLRLMDRARKLSLDARALEPSLSSDEKGGKLDVASGEIKRIYDAWEEDKGTQLVFLDRSVPKNQADTKKLEEYDKLVRKLEAAQERGDDRAARATLDALEKYDSNEMEEIRIAQVSNWNAYQQIKDNLIEKGIPAEEIKFISDAKTPAKKQELFDEVKSGAVRVLLGSSPKMGAGTDVQDLLVAIHHIDVTWKPSDIEQREGRIIRQGNKLLEKYGMDKFEVEIIAYTTDRTIDAKFWDLNSSKLKMINGIRNYDGEFNMEFDDESSIGMAEIAAIASGNPLQLERVKLSSDIDNLNRNRTSFERQKWGIRDILDKAKKAIADEQKYAGMYNEVGDKSQASIDNIVERAKQRSIVINGEKIGWEKTKDAYDLIDEEKERLGKKFSITVDGVKLKSVEKAKEAVGLKLGDGVAFEGEFDGQTFIQEKALVKALNDKVSALTEGVENFDNIQGAPLGTVKIYGIDLGLTADGEVVTAKKVSLNRLEITGEHFVKDSSGKDYPVISTYATITVTNDSHGSVVNLIRKIRDQIVSVKRVADRLTKNAKEAKEQIPVFEKQVSEEWPKQAEYDEKKARLAAVERELSGTREEEGPQSAEKYWNNRSEESRKELIRGMSALNEIGSHDADDLSGKDFSELPEDVKSAIKSSFDAESEMSPRPAFTRREAAPGNSKFTPAMIAGKARQVIKSLDLKNAPPVQVVQSETELPQVIQDAIKKDKAQGMSSAVLWDGKVWMVADNMHSANQVREDVLHEVTGHYGLRGVLGSALDNILDQVADHYGPQLESLAKRYKLDLGKPEERRRVAEEKLAFLQQDGTARNMNFAKKIYAMIRKALRKLGFIQKMNDADISQLLTDAYKFAREGKANDELTWSQPAKFSKGNPTFYSQMQNFLSEKLPGKNTGKGFAQMVESWAKKGQFKQAELEWSGLTDWLKEQDGKVTRQQVLDYLAENNLQVEEVMLGKEANPERKLGMTEFQKELSKLREAHSRGEITSSEREAKINELTAWRGGPPTKFASYQLPGGDNYRELLITMPESNKSERSEAVENFQIKMRKKLGKKTFEYEDLSDNEIAEFEKIQQMSDTPITSPFTSSHYDAPNILAHLRFNERTVNGKKVMFLEEVQSDWAQEGRKKGFKESEATILKDKRNRAAQKFEGKNYNELMPDSQKMVDNYIQEYQSGDMVGETAVPNTPFKESKNWSLLAIKRAIRWAAENGFDRVEWTTGEQQAERYDLSKVIDKIKYRDEGNGTYYVQAYQNGDTVLKLEGAKEGILEDNIGKELTKKIVNNEGVKDDFGNFGKLTGLDLKVGGEGMKGFYDKIVPAAVQKYVKKFGAKVGLTEGSRSETEYGQQWGFDVTDKMRDAAMAGQPLFTNKPDARYLELAKDPEKNKAELQKMVDDAAKAAGYNVGPLQHVTPYQGNIILPGGMNPSISGPAIWLSDYGSRPMAWHNTNGKDNVRTLKINAEINNPLKITTIAELKESQKAFADGSSEFPSVIGFDTPSNVMNAGYDGIIIDIKGYDREYLVFDQDRIKSTDPITYDDKGNVIPLSQRFDTKQDDIRFVKRDRQPKNKQGQSLFPEIQKELDANRGAKTDTLSDKAKNFWGKLKEGSRHFPLLDPKKWANLVNYLRVFEDTPGYSKYAAERDIGKFLHGLSDTEYDVFRMNIILPDMLKDVDSGLLDGTGKLPFGYQNREQLVQDIENFQSQINDKVKKSLEKRTKYMNELKGKLVKEKLLPKTVLDDDAYYHHQVTEYLNLRNKGTGTSTGDVRMKKKGWQKGRSGNNTLGYNTEYVEAEFEVIAQGIAQLETKKVMDRIDRDHNSIKALRSAAKKENDKMVYKVLKYDPKDISNKPEDEPFFEFRKKMAIAFGNLGRMASDGKLPQVPSHLQGVMNALADWKATKADIKEAVDDNMNPYMHHPQTFQLLSYLINKGEEGAIEAATIFKTMSDRRKFVSAVLGKHELSWQDFVDKETHVIWKPKPNSAWYMTNTINDKIIEMAIRGQRALEREDVKMTLARGSDVEWVLPKELAETLDNFRDFKDEGILSETSQTLLNRWKQWILINPMRYFKYNLNNMSGDTDIVFAYHPAIIKDYFIPAFKDLYAHMKGVELSKELEAEISLAMKHAVLSSSMSVNDIPDITKNMEVEKHLRAILPKNDSHGLKKVTGAAKDYWLFAKKTTTFRENILRLAAFRFFRDQLAQGKQVAGVSPRYKAEGVTNQIEKAAMLSRDLLGDYGNLSQTSQWLRTHLIPFWSWQAINAPRYVRLFQNMPYDELQTGQKGKARAVGTLAWAGGKLSLKTAALFAMVNLWNAMVWPEEEEELGEAGRRQMHLILGRRDDGSIISIRMQGALSDALSWFALEDIDSDVRDIAAGRASIGDKAKEAALAPAQKVVGGARPLLKTAAEATIGLSFYPDFLSPRPVRDSVAHILRTFSLDKAYNLISGKPKPGGSYVEQLGKDLLGVFAYSTDPGVTAYYDTRKLAFDFMEQETGKTRPTTTTTTKSNALYYYKQALRLGDVEAADKYLQKYIELGGKPKYIKTSIKAAHPLAGIPKKFRRKFVKSLSPKERVRYDRALKYYSKVYFSRKR